MLAKTPLFALALLAPLLAVVPPGLIPDVPATLPPDPYVNVDGDAMTGSLVMDAHAVVFDGRPLRAEDGTLRFGDADVCLVASPCRDYAGVTPIEVDGRDVRLSTAGCTEGETWLWDAGWSCDAPSASGDLVCAGCVGASDLAAGAVVGDRLADGAVTSAKLATGAVTGAAIAAGAVTLDKLAFDPATRAEIADRVAAPGFRQTAHEHAWVPMHPMAALGSDGKVVVAYFDGPVHDLGVLHCENLACTQATARTPDTAGHVGYWPSIAIGSDGFPVVAYRREAEPGFPESVDLIHCLDATCATRNRQTILTGEVRAYGVSLTVTTAGLPLVAVATGDGHLHLVRCSNLDCSSRTTRDVAQNLAAAPSLVVDGTGTPGVAYLSVDGLSYLRCTAADCSTSGAPTPVASGVGGVVTSATVGTSGYPLIATFSGGVVRVTACANAECASSPTRDLVTGLGTGDLYGSISMSPSGRALVAFGGNELREIRAARCTDAACASATVATVRLGYATDSVSVVHGVDGLPVIVSVPEGAVDVVHCSNPGCVPYARGR